MKKNHLWIGIGMILAVAVGFAVIGLYFGLVGLLQIMIYSLLLSAVVSIFLLAVRKAKMKSTMPMAPFIIIGLTVYFIFLSNLE